MASPWKEERRGEKKKREEKNSTFPTITVPSLCYLTDSVLNDYIFIIQIYICINIGVPLLTNETDSQDLGRLKYRESQKRKCPKRKPHVLIRVQFTDLKPKPSNSCNSYIEVDDSL